MSLDITKNKEIFRQRDVRVTSNTQVSQANYNTSDFSVASNIVNLKNKTSYLSLAATDFTSLTPATDTLHFTAADEPSLTADGNVSILCPIHLPQGAVITSVIFRGNGGAGLVFTWYLYRLGLDDTITSTMATAGNDVADTTITDATIDNQSNHYVVRIDLTNTEVCYGGTITYTTDYD